MDLYKSVGKNDKEVKEGITEQEIKPNQTKSNRTAPRV
jgi:hypothetical protein